MKSSVTYARLLLATSAEIERLPLIQRPRFMAATWGGLLVCKAATMVIAGPAVGLPLFAFTAGGGLIAVVWRFRDSQLPAQRRPRLAGGSVLPVFSRPWWARK